MAGLNPTGFFQEARRRRVFSVAAVYIVIAWIAVQVFSEAFPALDIPAEAIRFIWIGAIVGVPFALFFGWQFDLSDGRILRTAAVDGEPGSPIGRGDKLTLTIMTAALVAISVGLAIEISNTQVDDSGRPRQAIAAPNSLAVLPFANFAGAQENEYLADGITETLLHSLAQASGLNVTARTSSFFYKGKDIDIRDIAAELGVSKILEGSVQQSGDRIRIVAQLIEADTGFHLWSNTYDQDMGDIFAIQDSIASDVAIAILATMTAAPDLTKSRLTGVSTTNLEAYQKFLQGLEQARISSNISLPKAEVFFQQALKIDPDFYEARKELAYTYVYMMRNGTIPRQEAIAHLAPLRDTMLDIRPDDAAVNSLDFFLRRSQDRTSVDADDIVKKLIAAIERNPNNIRVYLALVGWLNTFGRQDEAIEWLNRALIVDPMDFELHYQLGNHFQRRGDTKRAVEAFAQVTQLNPQWPTGQSSLAWAEFYAGDPVAWYQRVIAAAALDPLDAGLEQSIAIGLMSLGLYEESHKHVARVNEINENDVANGEERLVSSLLSLLGDPAQSRNFTESILRTGVSSRDRAYQFLVWAYVSASIEVDKAQEAFAVIENTFPGMTLEDFSPTSTDEIYVQFWATVAWAQGKETSEVVARLDTLVPRWDAAAPYWFRPWTWTRTRGYSTTIAFLRGDMEEASRIAVESLRLDTDLLVLPFLYHQLYPLNVVAEQPSVAARLAEIEEQIRPGREALRAYIEENE